MKRMRGESHGSPRFFARGSSHTIFAGTGALCARYCILYGSDLIFLREYGMIM